MGLIENSNTGGLQNAVKLSVLKHSKKGEGEAKKQKKKNSGCC